MKSLRDLQQDADLRRGDPDHVERGLRRCVEEYWRHPSPASHRRIAGAVQAMILACGGAWNGHSWRAP